MERFIIPDIAFHSVYVFTSKIKNAGMGLFSRITIPKHKIITLYEGEYMTTDDDDNDDYEYKIQVNPLNLWINAHSLSYLLEQKYMLGAMINQPNNPKDANAFFMSIIPQQQQQQDQSVGVVVVYKPQVAVVSSRKIHPNDEILACYNNPNYLLK